jgi:hypothetical protein
MDFKNSDDNSWDGIHSSTDSPLEERTKDNAEPTSFSVTTPLGTTVEVRALRDVVSEVPAEREWTVEGLAPDCGLAVLGGRHKRGKSTLGLHLSRAVEAGDPFLDRETRRGPVVYINYEMSLDYFVSLANADPMPQHFYVVNRPEPKLHPESIRAIIGAIGTKGFAKGLMIIDSFRGAFKLAGEQENQSGAAGFILRLVQDIAVKSGWLIFVIHHHKKNRDSEGSENLSGTGDFGAAADVIWSWSRPADINKPGVLEIEGRIPPVDPLRVLVSPDECIYLGAANGSAEEEEKKQILDALGDERVTGKELAVKTGNPYSTVMKRLNALKESGEVDCAPTPGRGPGVVWFKADASQTPEDAAS